ncbi:MAG: polyprenyl synthetase family protein [Planctomycetota bacterium]
MTQSLSEILQEYHEPIEEALQSAASWGDGCPDRLGDAMRYALLAPGKRLRPAMALMAAAACGGSWTKALPAATAVEMVHAYSLIHDDLPAMDDDDLRRGRPTVHIQFDEATAILAGDALQAAAFAHLSKHVTESDTLAALVAELATAAGPTALVGGQADDLNAETLSPDVFDSAEQARAFLESIHRRKTGALIAAALRMGALSVGASAKQLDAISRYAHAVGLAFQITDDVLDHTSDPQTLGKRTGKDSGRGKFTYPTLFAPRLTELMMKKTSSSSIIFSIEDVDEGVRRARSHAESLIQSARQAVGLLGPSATRLDQMAEFVLERSH